MATTTIPYDLLDDQDLVGTNALQDEIFAALTPKQQQAIDLLTQGQSVSATARALGIHRTTIHNWCRTEPAFALALRDSERDASQHWRCATQARAEKALIALDRLLDDERTPATVRLKAVLHVLNTATAMPSAVDPYEQDLLAREAQQQRTRERNRAIDQMMADAEALHTTSDDELFEQLPQFQDTEEDTEEDDEEESPIATFTARSAGIHHNSSLFTRSEPVELFAKPKTVVYATPKPGRNERCPCQSGRKYKHCCLDKDNQRQASAASPPHKA